MARRELMLGSATLLAVVIAGFFSSAWVARHYGPEDARATAGTACVTADGSWRNWVWANVPMLSPKCE